MPVTAEMTRLVDNARIRLPGALDAAIVFELFSVMDEFFQASNIWYEEIDVPVTPTGNTYFEAPEDYTYTVTPTTGTIVRLAWVADANGFEQAARMPELGKLVLFRAPDNAQTYKVRVILTVANPLVDGYPEFPNWILEKYSVGILDGILGRMMSQIAKPYSSERGAVFHMRKFQSCKSKAKNEAARQNVYGAQSWRFPQTFNHRRVSKF